MITSARKIAALLLVAAVFGLSYKLTGIGGPSKRRFKSYFACPCVTYALAVAFAEINGSPAEAGRQGHERGGQTAGRDAPGAVRGRKIRLPPQGLLRVRRARPHRRLLRQEVRTPAEDECGEPPHRPNPSR